MDETTGVFSILIAITVRMRRDYGLSSDLAICTRNNSKHVTGAISVLVIRTVRHKNNYGLIGKKSA